MVMKKIPIHNLTDNQSGDVNLYECTIEILPLPPTPLVKLLSVQGVTPIQFQVSRQTCKLDMIYRGHAPEIGSLPLENSLLREPSRSSVSETAKRNLHSSKCALSIIC